jgi:hypothetical protein
MTPGKQKMQRARRMIWKIACPKIFLHMISFTIEADFGYGALLRMSFIGGSVAKASAPKVSITKLTQSIWTALSGESLKMADPKKTMAMAVRFTAS